MSPESPKDRAPATDESAAGSTRIPALIVIRRPRRVAVAASGDGGRRGAPGVVGNEG
jgi:hypothetical protein